MKRRISTMAVVSTVIMGLYGCGNKTPEEHIAVAKKFIAEGKADAAVIELKNAVIEAPNDASIRLQLGKVYLNNSEFNSADKELNKALDFGAKEQDVLPLLVKTEFYLGDYERAQKLADEARVTDPNVLSHIKLYGYLSALRSPLSPTELTITPTGLVGDDKVLFEINQALDGAEIKKARELLSTFSDPGYEPNLKLYVKGLVDARQQDYKSAAEALGKVRDKLPKWYLVSFQLSEALIQAKEYDQAEKIVDGLLKLNKENPYANLLKARIRFAQQDYAKALPLAEKAIQNGLNSKLAQIVAGTSALKVKKLEQAYRYLTQASQGMSKGSMVYRLLAQAQLMLGYTSEAQQTLGELQDVNSMDASLFSETGVRLAMQGDMDQAKAFLDKANQVDGKNAVNQLRAGMVKIATDDKTAIANIEAAIQQDQDLKQAWVVLAEAYLKQNKPDEALKVAKDWQVKSPADGLMLKGVIYQNLNKPEQAIDAFKQAIKTQPTHLGANLLLMKAYAGQKNYSAAINVGNNILLFAPDDMRAYTELMRIYSTEKKLPELESQLQQQVKDNEKSITPKNALALYYRTTNQPEKAIKLLTDAENNLNAVGYMVLGDANLQANDTDAAKSVYLDMTKKFPDDLRGWLRSIGAEEISHNTQGALDRVDQALSRFPNAPQLKLLKMSYLTRLGQLDKADQQLEDIKKAKIHNAVLGRYEGELALANKDFAKAEHLLKEYYTAHPSFNTAVVLARAMEGNGHYDDAAAILEKEFKGLSNPTRQRHTMAEFYTYNGKYQLAEKYYLAATAANPKDFVAFNNLAGVALKMNDPKKALAYAQKAHELAPGIAPISDTLGWSYFNNGQLDKAKQFIQEAADKMPDDMDIKLHLAEVLIAGNNKIAAKTLLMGIKNPAGYEAKIKALKQKL